VSEWVRGGVGVEPSNQKLTGGQKLTGKSGQVLQKLQPLLLIGTFRPPLLVLQNGLCVPYPRATTHAHTRLLLVRSPFVCVHVK
jgi:hypothetical protein